MSFCKYLTAASLATALSVSIASAATFTIDPGEVTVTGKSGCIFGDCKLSGVVRGGSFDLDTVEETASINDLFDWKVLQTTPWVIGGGDYKVDVTLNFSSPSAASAESSGYAGFATFQGWLSAGKLKWTSGIGSVDFSDGYKLSYKLEDTLEFGFGNSASTGATFTLVEAPAPVPLPASALLLMGGVGALGGLRARRKHNA